MNKIILQSETFLPSIDGWNLIDSVEMVIEKSIYEIISKKSPGADQQGITEIIFYGMTPFGRMPTEKRILSSNHNKMFVNRFLIS